MEKFENWKDCKGYEGLYQVSDKGRVWSVKRQRIMKPYDNGCGYLLVKLYAKNGKRKIELVHRLVALAFIPNPEHKPQVNHRDENKQNNCVENLEWCTCKENLNYGTHNERMAESKKKPVLCVELDRIFDSALDASRELNINNVHICDVLKGRYKTSGGYHWKYIEKGGGTDDFTNAQGNCSNG